MARKSKASRWVFYLDGPRANKGRRCWVSFHTDVYYGCSIAADVGVEIPEDTFENASVHVSQNVNSTDPRYGYNYTAILPLEV